MKPTTGVKFKAVSRPRKRAGTAGTTAVHATEVGGKHHAVGIWDLHVYIVPDGQYWFAQGLEIDYAAQGDSIEDAKKNFERGLEGTIDMHVRMDGNIENMLRPVPSKILKEALLSRLKGSIQTYSQVSLHDIGLKTSSLPFDNISYLIEQAA